MSRGTEIVVAIVALLCYAGCAYAMIFYSLKRKVVSKISIAVSFIIGGIGLYGSFGFLGNSDTLQIGGYVWTTVWIAKGIIEFIRYRKQN